MESTFEALRAAVANGDGTAATSMLRLLRERCPTREAFDAVAECARIELGNSRAPEAVARFMDRIDGAFDHDCDL